MFAGIPCRIYRNSDKAPVINQTAAEIHQDMMLALDNSHDIQAGDELIIHRGVLLGKTGYDIRAIAGEPEQYFEPFGAVMPRLAHQEVLLIQHERIGGGYHGSETEGGYSV